MLMSLTALAGGTVLYLLLRKRFARGVDGAPLVPHVDGRSVFDHLLVLVSWRGARVLERWLGTNRLQVQLRWLVMLSLAAACWAVWRHGLEIAAVPVRDPDIPLALLWAIGMACAVGAAWQAKFHRLVALMLTGGAGLVTCVTFVWFSAPDLALTQLLVEIVTTVLILLGLRWLPKRIPFKFTWAGARAALPRRAFDLTVALAAGAGLGTLAYAVMTRRPPDTISDFFVTRAYPEGGGTNVVNVILVDFRGFDTLGEITVLGAVAIAVYALLRRFRPARESIEAPTQQQAQDDKSFHDDMMLPLYLMRLMFAAIFVLAMYLLLRGHNLPGGGFVAGLTMAVALILQYMAGGVRWAEARLNVRPVRLIGLGLGTACATGLGAWFFMHPFLTSHTAHVELPLVGELDLPSAFMFDIGVFLLVVGATTLILIALSHQSIRVHHHHPASPTPSPKTPARETRETHSPVVS
jgi:multicomponent K+:H+ antiporter subunit A